MGSERRRGAAGGTADILAVTVSGATATAGQLIAVICSAANATSTPTLALNSGAAVPITAQGGKSGWANMIPGALFVGIFEYSTSNTWEILNPVTSFTPLSVTTAYSAGQKDAFKEIRSTAATTVTFAQTTMLSPSWSQSYFAQGGAIVFTPNASDQINGGTAGAAVTAPQGSYGFINTDGAGNLWISGVLGSAAFLPVATTATANAVVETNSGGTIDPSFVKGALSVTSVKSAGTTSTTGFTIATGDDLTASFATITEVNTAQATANTGVSNASSAQTSANNAQNTANAAYSLAASKWTPSVNTSTSGSAGPSIWQFALTWNGVTIGLAGVNCDCNCNCGG